MSIPTKHEQAQVEEESDEEITVSIRDVLRDLYIKKPDL